MGLTEIGTFPVTALNIGLAGSVTGIQAKISDLQASIGKATANAALALTFVPPNPAALAAGLLTIKDLTKLAAALNPATWITGAASFNVSLAAELGLINAALQLIGTLTASFEAGLSAGSLAGWGYSGRAAGFGETLAVHTKTGYGPVGPDDNINALIIATELFSSWDSFSLGFKTGSPEEITGPTTAIQKLKFLGILDGGQWNTGLLEAKLPIDLYLLELEAAKVNLEAQIDISLGLNLPNVADLINLSLNISIDDLLPALSIQTDFDAEIQLLNLKINILLDAIANINLALSGGGLTLWTYGGAAGRLGSSLRSALASGLPNAGGPDAPAYGLVIATEVPSAWTSFGLIFKTK